MENDIAIELGNVLLVGGGRMGSAIAKGMLNIDGMSPSAITIVEPNEDARAALSSELGVATIGDASEGFTANTIILAVKPVHLPDACASLSKAGIAAGTLIVSIAAGVNTQTIAHLLGNELPIVRVMPNTPLLVGYGTAAVSAGASATPHDCEVVRDLFSSMGKALIIEESLQDAVCAVSGSGPAYYELFCELIARAGESLGLPYEVSLVLALQTMLGTAELIIQTGQSLPEAIDAVSSPGGTTIAALDEMRANGIEDAITKGVEAAKKRSEELGA